MGKEQKTTHEKLVTKQDLKSWQRRVPCGRRDFTPKNDRGKYLTSAHLNTKGGKGGKDGWKDKEEEEKKAQEMKEKFTTEERNI